MSVEQETGKALINEIDDQSLPSTKSDDKSELMLSLDSVLIITDQALDDIRSILSKFGDRVRLEVNYSNGIRKTYDDFRQTDTILHTAAFEVTSLVFSTGDYRSTCIILTRDNTETVSVRSSGPFDQIRAFQSEIGDFIKNHRPWFSLIAKNTGKIAIGLPLLLLVMYLLYMEITGQVPHNDPSSSNSETGSATATVIILAFVGTLFAGEILLRKCFPRLIFSTGSRSNRKALYQKLHLTVATSIIAPLLFVFVF